MSEQDELKEFEAYCDGWIHRLGLLDWDWRCSLNDDADNANVLLNIEGRKAYIAMLASQYYSKEIVDDEIHKVINRLMVVL